MQLHTSKTDAVAAALKVAKKAHGGNADVPDSVNPPKDFQETLHDYREVEVPHNVDVKQNAKVHKGAIHSPVAGRTDHLPMHVESGSYVIPADIISAMGEGNTLAGFKIANSIFEEDSQVKGHPYAAGKTPYGAKESMYGATKLPYGMGKKHGGTVESPVPIVAAGGEYVVSPESVSRLGRGNMDYGHKILDSFVKKMRAKTVRTLQKLPGPKRS